MNCSLMCCTVLNKKMCLCIFSHFEIVVHFAQFRILLFTINIAFFFFFFFTFDQGMGMHARCVLVICTCMDHLDPS